MPGGQDSASPVHASQSGSGPNDRSAEAFNGQTPPWLQMIEVVLLWACFLGLQLGKGRFERCSVLYFVLFGCQALLSVAANVLFTRQARKAAEALQHGSSQPILTAPDGVAFIEPATWGLPALIKCSLVALAGGSVAGLLGIGGGMVIAPLLLELGLHPVVAAATSTLMVLFSASTAALAFGFEGVLNVTYALIFGIGCFIASLLGVWIVGRIVRRSGRPSYVVIILAVVIALGAILTGVFGGRKAILALKSGQHLGFHSFCAI